MKKNRMMRLASGLLIAVLLTTCTISGTFAKYVTADSGSDTARVAKWGVTVTADGSTFAEAYARDDQTLDANAASRIGVNSVVSGNSADVLAPGTFGSMTGFTLSGTPEVAVQVTYDVAKLDLANWEVDVTDDNTNNPVYYCPIIITVDGKEINGLDYTNVGAFKAAVIAAIEDNSTYYAAGKDLGNQVDHNLSVSWKWNFETNKGTAQWQSDIKDTALGNQAGGVNGGVAATIDLEVSCTVTQID